MGIFLDHLDEPLPGVALDVDTVQVVDPIIDVGELVLDLGTLRPKGVVTVPGCTVNQVGIFPRFSFCNGFSSFLLISLYYPIQDGSVI